MGHSADASCGDADTPGDNLLRSLAAERGWSQRAYMFGTNVERLFARPDSRVGAKPDAPASHVVPLPTHSPPADEEDALELARRVAASDVGDETISRLESIFDDLATAYPVTPPHELIQRIRLHLTYVGKLLDGRKTLQEHRRLITVGGWLSLLAATVHIDLKQYPAASARLDTASSLARHAGHDEIRAWCYETMAWRAVTEGDHLLAIDLARTAQSIAPAGSSAHIQATAQEGRAQARLRQAHETYTSMRTVEALVAAATRPERPGHHYQYDPDKVTAYSATTLAWLGDPAAETHARELIARLRHTEGNGKWPRRLASANLGLALALIVTDRLDEAAERAQSAISSGHIAPSNHWRALEVLNAIENRNLPEASDLREAFEALRSSQRGRRAN